jgi:hypothetical protein
LEMAHVKKNRTLQPLFLHHPKHWESTITAPQPLRQAWIHNRSGIHGQRHIRC